MALKPRSQAAQAALIGFAVFVVLAVGSVFQIGSKQTLDHENLLFSYLSSWADRRQADIIYSETQTIDDPSLPPDERTQKLAMRGWEYHRLGRDDLARRDFDAAIAMRGVAPKQRVEDLIWRSQFWFLRGEYDAAGRDLDAAILLDPGKWSYRYNRGLVFLRQHRAQSALAVFDALVGELPRFRSELEASSLGFGEFAPAQLRDKKKLDRIERLLEAAIYGGRAEAYRKVGQIEKSFADYNRAIADDPMSSRWWGGRAATNLAAGNWGAFWSDAWKEWSLQRERAMRKRRAWSME